MQSAYRRHMTLRMSTRPETLTQTLPYRLGLLENEALPNLQPKARQNLPKRRSLNLSSAPPFLMSLVVAVCLIVFGWFTKGFCDCSQSTKNIHAFTGLFPWTLYSLKEVKNWRLLRSQQQRRKAVKHLSLTG